MVLRLAHRSLRLRVQARNSTGRRTSSKANGGRDKWRIVMKLRNSICCTPVALFLAVVALTAPAHAASMLYAPTAPDNAAFRVALAGLIGGEVDYFDARVGTPYLSQLTGYDAVFTHGNYSYSDPVLFGNVLADYVDVGGRVILGQYCYLRLEGRIMQAAYYPVASLGVWGTYAHDGVDCVHDGVGDYGSVSITALQPGAVTDGTLTPSGLPGVAWRADRRVYFGGGNSGSGGWLQLTANMVLCEAGPMLGDINCDGLVNAFDIDLFVYVLTWGSPLPPEFYVYCGGGDLGFLASQAAADVNGDGALNTFDIDPFVECLLAGGCGAQP
jgi:hypothetical protein